MRIHWQTAVLAILLAISTWFLVTGREKVETWIPLTMEMTNTPEGLVIHKGMINRIEVRVRGPKGLVRSLDVKKLAYSLDVSRLKVGENLIDLDPDKVPLSQVYEVVEFKPPRLLLTVDRETVKTVPVLADWEGETDLDADYQLREIKVTPGFVQLKGPESMLRQITESRVNVSTVFEHEVPELWSEEVPVHLGDVIEAQPGMVRVDLYLGPKTQEIPVKVREFVVNPPTGFSAKVRDPHVSLTIEGPRVLFRNDKFRKDLAVVVRFPDEVAPGRQPMEYWVKLPEGCRLVDQAPDTLLLDVTKK